MTFIYALVSNSIAVYIGQTTNIEKREYDHKRNNKIAYSRLVILERCEDKEALIREKFYIKKYTAQGINLLNINHTKDNKFDEIDMQILSYLAEGLKAKEIEPLIYLSHRTIETRTKNIKRKLKVKHLGALIYKSFKLGLIS